MESMEPGEYQMRGRPHRRSGTAYDDELNGVPHWLREGDQRMLLTLDMPTSQVPLIPDRHSDAVCASANTLSPMINHASIACELERD